MTMEKTVFERLYPTPTQRSLRQIREPLKQSGSNVVSDEEKIQEKKDRYEKPIFVSGDQLKQYNGEYRKKVNERYRVLYAMNKTVGMNDEQEVHMKGPEENSRQKKAMNYSQLDWQLKGNTLERNEHYEREFGKSARQYMGDFCMSVCEDAIEKARKETREATIDKEVQREI